MVKQFTRLNDNKSDKRKRWLRWFLIGFPIYVLSIGPVAWATNDAFHPRYLPDAVNWIYLPLAPLLYFEWIHQSFEYYTAVIWGGFPAGYTTL